jgi:hypothetical protein
VGLTLGVASVLALGVIGILTGILGRPLRYEIPEGFGGWATVTYGNPSCVQLDVKGLFLVVRIDSTGRACTSSPMPSGWRFTKFFRVQQGGGKSPLVSSGWSDEASRMIWAGAVMTRQGGYANDGEVFFVGTAQELNVSWAKQPVPNVK